MLTAGDVDNNVHHAGTFRMAEALIRANKRFDEAGFRPEQAVQIMTANGARLLGLEATLGTVSVGKAADLVVIDGDPVTEPSAIRSVVLVFKDGIGYDSARLMDSVR